MSSDSLWLSLLLNLHSHSHYYGTDMGEYLHKMKEDWSVWHIWIQNVIPCDLQWQ